MRKWIPTLAAGLLLMTQVLTTQAEPVRCPGHLKDFGRVDFHTGGKFHIYEDTKLAKGYVVVAGKSTVNGWTVVVASIDPHQFPTPEKQVAAAKKLYIMNQGGLGYYRDVKGVPFCGYTFSFPYVAATNRSIQALQSFYGPEQHG